MKLRIYTSGLQRRLREELEKPTQIWVDTSIEGKRKIAEVSFDLQCGELVPKVTCICEDPKFECIPTCRDCCDSCCEEQ